MGVVRGDLGYLRRPSNPDGITAVEADHPGRVRAAVAERGVKLPAYLAIAETRRRFGALEVDLR
jgi:hypothetical protein